MPRIFAPFVNKEYTTEGIKKEIEAIKVQNPECVILKLEYNDEAELDKDWQEFLQMGYDHRYLANATTLRLYGMKNEDIYYALKKKFLSYDIETDHHIDEYEPYKESTEYDIFAKNKMAKDYMAATGYYLITGNHNNLEDLEAEYYKFKTLPAEKRVKADTYSYQLYNMKNEEHYQKQLKHLLKQDIEEDERDEEHEYSIPKRYDDDRIEECLNSFYSAKNEKDKYQGIHTLNETLNHLGELTPIEELIVYAEEEKALPDYLEEPEFRFTPAYYLPDKMTQLGVFSGDLNQYSPTPDYWKDPELARLIPHWFACYQARNIGLKPPSSKFNKYLSGEVWKAKMNDLMEGLNTISDEQAKLDRKQTILEFGWNPEIPFTERNLDKRLIENKTARLQELGYRFIDISKMQKYSIVTESAISDIRKNKGIIVVFCSDENLLEHDNSIVAKCYVSTDFMLDAMYYPMNDGAFMHKISLVDLIHMHPSQSNLHIRVFYMKLPTQEYEEKLVKMLQYMKLHQNDYRFKYGFVSDICGRAKIAIRDIGNEKLFCVYLMNMLLGLLNKDWKNPAYLTVLPSIANLRGNPKVKDYIYNVYDGLALDYNPYAVETAIENLKGENTNINPYLESAYTPYFRLVPVGVK